MKEVKKPGFSRALILRHRQEINAMLRFLVVLLFCGSWIFPAGTQYAVVVGISTFRDLPEQAWLEFATPMRVPMPTS